MRSSIRTRLTVAFIGLAIGPLLLVGVVQAWQSYLAQLQQGMETQREVAQRAAVQIAAFVRELESELRMAVQVADLADLDQDIQETVLSRLISFKQTKDAFEEVALLDSEGQELARISRLEALTDADLQDRSQADEFLIPLSNGETYFSPVSFDAATGEPFMTMAVPLLDARSGVVDGVLVADIRLKEIWDLVAEIRVGQDGSAYIVDLQGRVVAHPNSSVVLRGTRFAVPDKDGIQDGLDGTSAVLASHEIRLGEQALFVVTEKPVFEALAFTIRTLLITASLVLIALTAAGALAYLVVRQLIRPLEALALVAQAIGAGDLSRRARVGSNDELGMLASEFNTMAAAIAEKEAQLLKRARHLELLNALTRAAIGAPVFKDMLQILADQLEKLFDADGCYISLWDETKQIVVPAAASSPQRQAYLALRIEPGEVTMTESVLRAGHALVAEDVFDSPYISARIAAEFPARSLLGLPLIAVNRWLGGAHIAFNHPHHFTSEEIARGEHAAGQIALALEKALLLEEVSEGRERMRWLARRVVSAQESERKRVARELHDEAGQALTALKISLELIRADLPEPTGGIHRRMSETVALAETTMEHIRLLAQGLRPPELDALGLNATLEGFCRDFGGRTQLSVDYEGVDIAVISDSESICLYRFLQEGLTNVAKHADADHVHVALRSDAEMISLSIEDDGRGFDVDAALSATNQPKGLGLMGIRERLALLRGWVEIHSEIGRGAQLVARVPSR